MLIISRVFRLTANVLTYSIQVLKEFSLRCVVPPQLEPRVLKRGQVINAGHREAVFFVGSFIVIIIYMFYFSYFEYSFLKAF